MFGNNSCRCAHMFMADNDDHTLLIDKFLEITGATDIQARRCLESSSWNFETSIRVYFEAEDPNEIEILDRDRPDIEILETHDGVSPVPVVQEPPEERFLSSSDSDSDHNDVQLIGCLNKPVATNASNMSKKKFGSLFDGKKDDGQGSSDEEDKGQAFYVGGSEKSGQEVLGPPRQPGPSDLVNRLFQSAQRTGAEPMDAHDQQQDEQPSFGGVGRRLDGTPDHDHAQRDQSAGPPQAVVTMKFWQDGFSIDDGPLRAFDDSPENRDVMQSISQSVLPSEIVRAHRGAVVDLRLENRHAEKFQPPPLRPFSGQGHMLGAVLPPLAPPPPPDGGEAAAAPAEDVEIDAGQPTTQLQIRLADGSRVVAKFNDTHTVADVRAHICRRRPEYAGTAWTLMTTFPNRPIADETQTLRAAGLLNAVVVVKPLQPAD